MDEKRRWLGRGPYRDGGAGGPWQEGSKASQKHPRFGNQRMPLCCTHVKRGDACGWVLGKSLLRVFDQHFVIWPTSIYWTTRSSLARVVGGLGWRRGKAPLFVCPLALDSTPIHSFIDRLVFSLCCRTRTVVLCCKPGVFRSGKAMPWVVDMGRSR
jgi:hypothetical protein